MDEYGEPIQGQAPKPVARALPASLRKVNAPNAPPSVKPPHERAPPPPPGAQPYDDTEDGMYGISPQENTYENVKKRFLRQQKTFLI